MSFMLKKEGIFHPSIFEELLFVAEVGLSLPCSNAWPERGGTVINITKTKFCNRLSNDMLNSLMQVSINAAVSGQCSDVKSAVDNWLKKKPRKKLKKHATVSALSGMIVETSQPSERESQVVELQTENTEEVPEGGHGGPDAATQEDRQSDNEEVLEASTFNRILMLINFNFYYIHSIFIICIYRFKYMYLFNSEKPH